MAQDQAAWKIGMFKHLWELTGVSDFWHTWFLPRPGERNEPHHPKLDQYFKNESIIRERSDYGFVGMTAEHDYRQVALHSCGGWWWGCIPKDAPALVQHHGRQRATMDVIHEPMLRVLRTWLALAIDRSRATRPAPAASAPQARRLLF